jgi:hypothetical protein
VTARRWRGACLAVLMALTIVAAEAPLIHGHTDEEPGWYDQECPLSRLAAGLPGLPAVESDPQASRVPVGDQQRPADCHHPRQLGPFGCEARGPPRAS